MKKLISVLLLTLALMLAACEQSDLPPEPGSPGEGNIVSDLKTGAARYVPQGYAPPEDVFDDDKQIFFLNDYFFSINPEQEGIELVSKVSHDNAYVYKYGYIWRYNQWHKYEFPQETVGDSNWIRDDAKANLELSGNEIIPGENYIVSYSCKQHDGQWKCGCRNQHDCGYWMLHTFLYTPSTLPPEPEEPGSPTTMHIDIIPSQEIEEQNKETPFFLYFSTSWDISQTLNFDTFPLALTKPDQSTEVLQLERFGEVHCDTDVEDVRFSCGIVFSTSYTPTQIGDYTLSITGNTENLPEYIRINEGSLRVYSSEQLDEILIRENIENYKVKVGTYGWYSDSVESFYARYYQDPEEYDWVSVRVSRGDSAVSQHFDSWLRYGEDIEQRTIIVDGISHTVYWLETVYQYSDGDGKVYSTYSNEVRWPSNDRVVSISVSSDGSLPDLEPIVRAYLQRYPADEPIQCNSNEDCPSEGSNYCNGSSACTSYTHYQCENNQCVSYGGGGSCQICEHGCSNGKCEAGGPEGDEYGFASTTDKLNLYQELRTIKAILTSEELSTLGDGTFRGKETVSYTQRISAPDGARVIWDQDDEVSDDPVLMLNFPSNKNLISYELRFVEDAVSDVDSDSHLEDFESSTISMLGKEYAVTNAELKTGGVELILMRGDVQDTVEVGQNKTYTIEGKEYDTIVMIVSGNSSKTATTKFVINDEVTPSLSADEMFTLKDGTVLGIKEVVPVKNGDVVQNIVEFYLGAEKIVFDGVNNELDIYDRIGLDDIYVQVEHELNSGDVHLKEIVVALIPTSDLNLGDSLIESAKNKGESDYVLFLETFGLDYHYRGFPIYKYPGEIKIDRLSDENMRLSFTSKNGIDYNAPLVFAYPPSTSFIHLGEKSGKELHVKEGSYICDENYFVVESNENSRVLQLTNIKNADDSKHVKIKDIGSGDVMEFDFDPSTRVADMNIDGYTYKVRVENLSEPRCVTGTELTDDGDGIARLWTVTGIEIELTNSTESPDQCSIFFTEPEQEDDGSQDTFCFAFTLEESNQNIDFDGSVKELPDFELSMLTFDSNPAISRGYTKFGNLLRRDTSADQDVWTIFTHPHELAFKVSIISNGGPGSSDEPEYEGDVDDYIIREDIGDFKYEEYDVDEGDDDVAFQAEYLYNGSEAFGVVFSFSNSDKATEFLSDLTEEAEGVGCEQIDPDSEEETSNQLRHYTSCDINDGQYDLDMWISNNLFVFTYYPSGSPSDLYDAYREKHGISSSSSSSSSSGGGSGYSGTTVAAEGSTGLSADSSSFVKRLTS